MLDCGFGKSLTFEDIELAIVAIWNFFLIFKLSFLKVHFIIRIMMYLMQTLTLKILERGNFFKKIRVPRTKITLNLSDRCTYLEVSF